MRVDIVIRCVVIMWKAVLCSLFYTFVYVRSTVNMIGPGRWTVLDMELCDEPDQYEMVFHCTRSKMNRTHDGFTAFINLQREINERDFSILLDIYREVDGGWKYYQKMTDDSLCKFVRKYAKENMEQLLTMGGVDPPDCPIKPGQYKVEGFMLDYNKLPEKCVYGKYKVFGYIIEKMQKIGCTTIVAECKEVDDDYED